MCSYKEMWRTVNRTGNRQEGKKINYILSDGKRLTLKQIFFSTEQILREHLKID